MSIWVKIKVTDEMKEHVRVYAEMFYENVIEKASLNVRDVSLLIYMMQNRKKKDWWQLSRSTERFMSSHSVFDKSLNKLVILGLITKEKHPKDKRSFSYVYKEAERNTGM